MFEGEERLYHAKRDGNGYEAASDTVKVNDSIATGVYVKEPVRPGRFMLLQNYLNPFNPSGTIRYGLRQPARVKVSIYDCMGSDVKIMVDEFQEPGSYALEWDSGGMA